MNDTDIKTLLKTNICFSNKVNKVVMFSRETIISTKVNKVLDNLANFGAAHQTICSNGDVYAINQGAAHRSILDSPLLRSFAYSAFLHLLQIARCSAARTAAFQFAVSGIRSRSFRYGLRPTQRARANGG